MRVERPDFSSCECPGSSAGVVRTIPKGFRNKAQGCEERAHAERPRNNLFQFPLGSRGGIGFQPQRGCGRWRRGRGATSFEVETPLRQCTQGRRGAPTLGFGPGSLWDPESPDLDVWGKDGFWKCRVPALGVAQRGGIGLNRFELRSK